MKLSICRLCDEEKTLRKSHVIPRSVFKKALKGFNHGRIIDRKYNRVINSQDQWATYLLCAECEHHLNRYYEEYSMSVLRNKNKTVSHFEKEQFLQIEHVDQGKLILYVVSILWRALESDHHIFNNLAELNLASSIKELFKNCIKENSLPGNLFFSVRISKLINKMIELEDKEIDFITNFTINAVERKRIRFLAIFDGYCYELFLHSAPNDYLDGFGVLKNRKTILKLPYVEAFSIPELKDCITELMEAKRDS